MGYFRDEHWIIEGSIEQLEKIRNEIIDEINKAFIDEIVDYSNYISPVLIGLANEYTCLFIPADGSKEGWGTSNNMDEVREAILKKVILINAKSKNDKITIIQVVLDENEAKPHADWVVKTNY